MIKPIVISLFLSALLAACSNHKPIAANQPLSSDQETLYQALGGAPKVEQIVDAFIKNIAKDAQIIGYFYDANVDHFRQGFIQHFCEATDGPCTFEGDSMHDIHTGMNITEGDFNRVVELLVQSLEQAQVSYPLQNRILKKLAPLRTDIIKI
ncbi:group 1 truncated hemoglobin [Thalassotalea sp. W431]|uniref:Group 1 truncated hemoglobin n=1 Tax=Thalassotalea castellviae TaxID=3075612 RepID=A0ABU3A2E4_9GAMM|nr:group 1 truncated hemoglobin [Thalassotalea sp. W431]MDT0603965.1 group 1 truncated hemoglobin [Thalassotalea sp. W431]